MDSLWQKIYVTESAHPAMAAALELVCSRRGAANAVNELDEVWKKLSDEMELRLKNLQKVGGRVLDEYLQGVGSRTSGTEVSVDPDASVEFTQSLMASEEEANKKS